MATSNNLKSHKSISIILFIYLLLVMNVNSAEFLSFSFSKFEPNQESLILQGDALVRQSGKLELTKVDSGRPVSASLGRALYAAPVRIYDNATGNLASFVTSFSFVIKATSRTRSADGLAFFLAPVGTQPQKPGGFLGLFKDKNFDRSSQVVAFEIDTFINDEWDPQGRHIGIDVNSINSVKTSMFSLANGEEANVDISYQASTKILSASVVYPARQTSFIVSAVVDLRDALPEFVSVGFSAATGLTEGFVESHDILSWSFESRLADGELENNKLASVVLRD